MNILVSACLLGVECRYDGTGALSDVLSGCINDDKIRLIPVCPEIYGGLPTPRIPCEISRRRVVGRDGEDYTELYEKGAAEALKLAKLFSCEYAILKDRSPSCGYGKVYDGTFSGVLTEGNGVTADMLADNGVRIISESKAAEFLVAMDD